MRRYNFIGTNGDFEMADAGAFSYLYFPITNEAGVLSSLTPSLGGDIKTSQNTFLMEPVSAENLHESRVTRNFWIFDGKPWSATGVSAAQLAGHFFNDEIKTFLRAGMLWHEIEREDTARGLKAVITSFAPVNGAHFELMKVVITNISNEVKTITPTAAVPMYGRSADNIRDHRHVTSLLHRTEVRSSGVCIKPTLSFDERGHRINEVAYGVFGVEADGTKPAGFFPVTEDYIGEGGSFTWPEVVVRNLTPAHKAGDTIDGYETTGAIRFADKALKPGDSATYIIGMGFGNSFEGMENEFASFDNEDKLAKEFEDSKAYWQSQVNVSYLTSDPDFDNWMYWVNLQPSLRRIYGCSFLPHHDYGKGGRGWRDLWQDCLALLMMNPDGVRDMLLANFGGVRMDGSNATIIGSGQGVFIADRNNITRVWMDHGMWPFLTTELYINQSGDLKFLLAENTYFKDPQAVRGEEKDTLWNENEGNRQLTKDGEEYRGSIFEHMLLQHLATFFDAGEHGHMRLRGADWNDALDMAKERGESVAFTGIYADNLAHMAELLKVLSSREGIKSISLAVEMDILLSFDLAGFGNTEKMQKTLHDYCHEVIHTVSGRKKEYDILWLAETLKKMSECVKDHIRATELVNDGKGNEWFNGYYDNNGRQVEGGDRMMLTGQVFSIMSGVASDEQVAKAVKAADIYLFDEKVGGYRLNSNFNELKTDMGRMFGFAYGTKENGAVFSHMTTMYANALYKRGFAKEGYKALITLACHCIDTDRSKIYPGVPEYIDPKGRGLYHYLTGAASWLLLTVVTEMFGVKGELGDLVFEPKLLASQFDEEGKAGICLDFAGRHLAVTYVNNEKKEVGEYKVQKVECNGKAYGNLIPRDDILTFDKANTQNIVVFL